MKFLRSALPLIVALITPKTSGAREPEPPANTTTSAIAPTLTPEDVAVSSIHQIVDLSEKTEGFEDLQTLVETFGLLSFRRDQPAGGQPSLSLRPRARFDPEEQISAAAFTVWVSAGLDWMSGLVEFAEIDTDSVGYIIDIRPLLGHVERNNSTLRPLVERIEPNAANWYNDKVISFPERWADDSDEEPAELSEEEAQKRAEEEARKPRPDPARALTVGQVRRIVLEHFGSEPGSTPFAVDVPATRRYAAVCLSQALQKRARQLEQAIIKVRLTPSKVLRDEMLRDHGVDLAEGSDGVFNGLRPLTRRDAARWLIAAHDASNSYARKAIGSVDNPSQRKVLALREMRETRAASTGSETPDEAKVADLQNDADRKIFQALAKRKIWLVDKGEDGKNYRLNPDETIRPEDFDRVIVGMYGLRESLDLAINGREFAAFDYAHLLKEIMDFHKREVEATVKAFKEGQQKEQK